MPEDEGTAPRSHRDRRAPVAARYQMELEAGRFAEEVAGFARLLGELEPGVRRRTRTLVGQFVAEWLAAHGRFGSLTIVVLMLPERVRVEIAAKDVVQSHIFWQALLTPHIRDLTIDCGVDRRSASGVWFEFERDVPEPAS